MRSEMSRRRPYVIAGLSRRWRSVRANSSDRARVLPEFIPSPVGAMTHAITIAAKPDAVWPWVVQMGAGFAFDACQCGHRPSPWV